MTSRTWNGTSADWSVGSDWAPTGTPGTADLAILNGTGTYVVTIGTSGASHEVEQPGSIAISDPNATLSIATSSTLAVQSVLDLAAGTIALGSGVLQGGTVDLAGGTLTGYNATLDGVTFLGTLDIDYTDLQSSYIEGGLTLDTAQGTAGGTLALNDGELTFLNSATLDYATILTTNFSNDLFANSLSLTLGSHLTLDVSDSSLLIEAGSLANHGTINVGAGGDAVLAFTGGLFTNNGAINVAAGGTLTLDGTLTSAQLQTIAAGITNHGVLLVEGTLENTGSVISVGATGSLAGLQIDGSVIGGTIINTGSLTFGGYTALDGVTLWGPLVVQSPYAVDVEIGTGTTLLSATGGTGGTLVADSPYGFLNLDAGVTLSHLLIEAEAYDLTIDASPTVAFGTGLDLAVTGLTEINAIALANSGLIQVTSGAALDLLINTITNAGTIAVAAGGTLGLGVVADGSALGNPLIYSGTTLSLAAGSTLLVGNSLTTAQLDSLLSGQSGVSVDILGTPVNSGATLLVGSGPISALTIDGDIFGGSIDTVSGTLALAGGTLDGTTLLGPAAITGYGETIDILGGITASAIGISGGNDAIVVLDSETLDNLALTISASTYDAEDFLYGTTLAIGAHATLATGTDLQIAATTLTNAGSLATAGSNSALFLYGTSLVNNGSITIGTGDTLGLNVAPYGANADLPIALSGTGGITLHPGAALDLGGVTNTATLENLLGGQTGVDIIDYGTLQNGGATIDATASNVFGTLTLAGDLRGGTLIGAGGSVAIATGTLDGVDVQGSIDLAGLVTFVDNVALSGAGGTGPATLDTTAYDVEIILADAEALANAAIVVSSGDFSIVAETPTLSISANTTIDLVSDVTATFSGTTIANAGTISTTSNIETVFFASSTIRQSGIVSIGSSDILGLDVNGNGGLGGSLSLVGSFALAAGATLDLGQTQTTQQLQTLLSQISNAAVAVELAGTLQNAGSTLAVGSGLLATILLDGDIIGGAITQSGGTLSLAGGTLSGVVVDTPLTLDGGLLYVDDNTSFGAILVANGGQSIEITDAETFNATTVTVAGGQLTLDESAADPLSLAAATTFEISNDTVLYANATIDNAATLLVSPGTALYGPDAYLAFQAATIVNSGLINVAAGATLALDPDSFGQTLSFTDINNGAISLATGATLQVGGLLTTAQLLALLGSISAPGVDLVLDGTVENAGSVLDLAAGGLLGHVELAGSIVGGTILDAGASIGFEDAILAGVTWQGPLTLAGNGTDLTLLGGLSVLSSSGTTPGTLALAGGYEELNVEGAASLNQLALNVAGASDILQVTTLTLAGQVQTNVSGVLTVQGETLINQGVIAVAGTGAQLLLQSNSFVNTGLITVGAGDLLDLGSPYSGTAPPLSTNGAIDLAAGATLEVGGVLTTAQLLALLGSISNSGVSVELAGTLINTGATLGIGTSKLLSNVILDADIIGGVIAPGAGTINAVGGTLDGVTWLGTLDLAGYDAALAVTGGLTLESAAGGLPGTLALAGEFNTLNILDTENFNNVVIDATGYSDTIAAGTLTLGAAATLGVTAPLSLDFSTLINSGTIEASGVGSDLYLRGTSLVNNGSISIAAGEALSLSPPYGGSELALGGTGAVSIATGATLSIGDDETTAQLLSQIGSLGHAGVVVELAGSLNNTGTILNAAAGGLLGTLVIAGQITGGTIAAGTGSIIFLGGYLDDLTYQGTLAVSGDENEVDLNDVVLEGSAGGLPGTIFATGADNSIGFLGTSAALANVVIIGTPDISVPITDNYFAFFGDPDGTLTIAPSVTSEADSELAFYAGLIDNAGTIEVSGAGASVSFVGDTIVNSGKIVVGAGDALSFGYYDPVTISGGGFTFETGSTLALDGLLTTSQFLADAGSLVTNAGVEVAIGIFGTLDNQGTTLTVAAGGPVSDLGFIAGGLAYGGTIIDPGAASFLGDNFLDGVTWLGAVTLESAYAALELIGTTTILSGNAAPASIALLGSNDSLVFDPSDVTEDGVSSGVLSQNISDTVITLASAGANAADTLLLDGPGTLTLAPSATIIASGNAILESYAGTDAPAVLLNQGSIFATGDLTIEAYGTTASFVNAGTVILAGGATLDFLAAGLDTGSILFADGAETLRLEQAGSVAATLLNFTAGDTIDLAAIPDNATMPATGTLAGGVLDIYSGGSLDASLALPGFAYSQASLVVGSDNAGGTEVTIEVTTGTPPCFLAGTRIRTTEGECPVEALRVGMQVPTLAGAVRPIVWLGHRRVNCRLHPSAEKIWPVRVRQGAFAPHTPQRDLLLSPDHAVFADGVLIPIRALINGTTISQESREELTYFHVELDSHDILLAEGLACESYLDTANRSAFANGGAAVQLHPDFAPDAADEACWEAAGCAPLRIEGRRVLRVAQRLQRRAILLGHAAAARQRASRAVPTTTDLADLLQPAWYLATNEDVARSGLDAATHYAAKGRHEGRLPCPEADLLRGLGLLDGLTVAITMADVVAARIDPATHFCRAGWRERRRPNFYFDTDWYADTYDVPPDRNPLLHYLMRGEPRGLPPSRHFDPHWYRHVHKLAATQSPLAHYLAHRRGGQVSPRPDFDVVAYRRAHPVRPDRDPYAHFLATQGGWHEPCLSKSA